MMMDHLMHVEEKTREELLHSTTCRLREPMVLRLHANHVRKTGCGNGWRSHQ